MKGPCKVRHGGREWSVRRGGSDLQCQMHEAHCGVLRGDGELSKSSTEFGGLSLLPGT